MTDEVDAPAFGEESYAFELAENVDGRVNWLSLGTVTATDPDSDTVRYSLLDGNDSSLFNIDETSGELFYVGAGEDYEGGVTSYELTVQASDGTHASAAAVRVALGDVRGHSEPEGGDLPHDRTTTGLVLVDEGAVTGNIEMWWDLDWFAVELVAGRTYQIDFRGQAHWRRDTGRPVSVRGVRRGRSPDSGHDDPRRRHEPQQSAGVHGAPGGDVLHRDVGQRDVSVGDGDVRAGGA